MHNLLGDLVGLRWVVLLHVAGLVAFALAHGVSVAVLLRLPRERDVERVRVLLDLSRGATGASWNGLGLLALTGAWLASVEHTWGERWVWGSVVVLGVLAGAMSLLGARPLNHVREAAGAEWWDGRRTRGPGPADPQAMRRALDALRPGLVTAVGLAGLAVLLWMMVMRPALGA